MDKNVGFVEILAPRRSQSGILSFMTRRWNPQTTQVLDKYCSPQELKDIVANSVYLDAVIEAESTQRGISKNELRKEIKMFLEEMGFEKKLYIIRWMGVIFLKICFMMKVKLFVNEAAILKLKSSMGGNPVLFLPTHRSYADFCVMTYLCYHYNVDFPTVAAGMDFYSMAVIGRRMRETCAFYIRRTLAGSPLYAATLKQYVRTVVANHCAPVEFFLEGTRSRSNKSLPPKFGMLSMTLMPFFAHEVSDITIVPINVSYDRLIEHGLFAYEHLGVPKPKESTGGFLKALSSLNDNFGNIYINLDSPLSVREYIKKEASHPHEVLKPRDLQQITPVQFKAVQELAGHVIAKQQDCTVATISNLMALVLMQSLVDKKALCFAELLAEVEWMMQVLRDLGAKVFEQDVKSSVERILLVHKRMMALDKDDKRRLRLVAEPVMNVSADIKKKMKGHELSGETMATAIPVIQLQLYVNPILHYIVPPAIICVTVLAGPVTKHELAIKYHRIRTLLSHEFIYLEKTEEETFNSAFEYCRNRLVVTADGGQYSADCGLYSAGHGDSKLRHLLRWSVWPALNTLAKCIEVMSEIGRCEHKQALKLIQRRVESARCHPYCLSLDAISNCLQGLCAAGGLLKQKTNEEHVYHNVPEVMQGCQNLVNSVLPVFNVDFCRKNSVVYDAKINAKL